MALKSRFLYLEEQGKPAQEQTVSSLEGWVRFSAKTVGYKRARTFQADQGGALSSLPCSSILWRAPSGKGHCSVRKLPYKDCGKATMLGHVNCQSIIPEFIPVNFLVPDVLQAGKGRKANSPT